MKNGESRLEFTGLVIVTLLVGSFGSVDLASAATQISATGFASAGPEDDMGNVTVQGFHAAVLNLVAPEDANKSWNLRGELYKCTLFPLRLSTECSKSGNTNSTLHLSCETQADALCTSLSSGVRSSTSASVVNTPGVSDHHSSSCAEPACSGGGGCPDPPSEHPTPPKSEFFGASVSAEQNPLILAIKGRGVFAEKHLALLYDDGFDLHSAHRLAFVTMPPPNGKEPRPVYSTQDLPSIFGAQYSDARTTHTGDFLDEEHIRTFFDLEGARAVIDLGNGYQIGLVDQKHNETWFIDLKQYLRRYHHPRGLGGLSAAPGDPVTLSLATVFIWDGQTWVTDPLQVLEALSEAFVPTTEELARLRSAVRW